MATPTSDFKATFATNPDSKFKEWSIHLSNGATLTGISYIPAAKASGKRHGGPLVIGIHGGTCSAYTYDVSPEYTASIYSELLSVPFIAIHRPNFLGSSGWLVDRSSDDPSHPKFTATEGLSYFQEEGRWFHEMIFPAIWKEFAVPNDCTSIVTTSHSMGVKPTIIASTLYSAEAPEAAGYVWAGMILSGSGEQWAQHFPAISAGLMTNEYLPSQLPLGQDSSIHFPPFYQADKEHLMLGPPGVCEDYLRPLIWKQTTPFLLGEGKDLRSMWQENKQRYKEAVKIPVLCGMGEFDFIWHVSRELVESFCKDFVNCPRIEAAVVDGAPHAIELSKAGRGWWIRCFGWAIEVDDGLKAKALGLERYD